MISIVFILGWTICVWSVAIIIFNLSQTETAAHLAAQGAITEIDRTWNGRADDNANYNAVSLPQAQQVADNLVMMNTISLAGSGGQNPQTAHVAGFSCAASPGNWDTSDPSNPVLHYSQLSFTDTCGESSNTDVAIQVEVDAAQPTSGFPLVDGLTYAASTGLGGSSTIGPGANQACSTVITGESPACGRGTALLPPPSTGSG
jgi:hypothetical protein